MKKLLLVLLVSLGLQTQAQINYCDSIEINLVSSSAWCNLETNISSLNLPPTASVGYDWTLVDPTAQWNWAGWDASATPNFWLQPNTTTNNVNPIYWNDTLVICLTITITDSSNLGNNFNCYNSCEDTLFWDGVQWNLLSMIQQSNYNPCDSISYSISSGPNYPFGVHGNISPTLNDDSDTVEFNWAVCAGGLCYANSGLWAYFAQVNLTDTVQVCYDAYIIINNNIDTTCYSCNYYIYDGNSWILFNMSNPTSINELTLNKINNNKIYDLLGRELNEIPVGTMYIRNNKLYITR